MLSAAQRFLQYLQVERDVSDLTVKSYREDLEALIEYLMDLYDGRIPKPSEVTTLDLRGYQTAMNEAGLATATISRRLASLRSFFRFGLRDGYATDNPAAPLDNPDGEDYLPYVLSKQEIGVLLQAPPRADVFGIRDRAILETMYSAGLRVSELVGLNIGDLNLVGGIIRVREGKGKKERDAMLGSFAAKSLKSWFVFRKELLFGRINAIGLNVPALSKRRRPTNDTPETPVFLNKFGSRLTTRSIARMLEKYLNETGLDRRTTPHTLRHSFATHLLDSGADIRSIQELLGHEHIVTTQIYTRVSTAMLKKVYEKAHPRAR